MGAGLGDCGALGDFVLVGCGGAVFAGFVLFCYAGLFLCCECCFVAACEEFEVEVYAVCAAHEDNALHSAAFAFALLFEGCDQCDEPLFWWNDGITLLQLCWCREVVLLSLAFCLCRRTIVYSY